jgi:hypothetical protein
MNIPTLEADQQVATEEKWEQLAPVDPLLLKHLGGPFYVVLAAWDLTDVERAVMTAGLRM